MRGKQGGLWQKMVKILVMSLNSYYQYYKGCEVFFCMLFPLLAHGSLMTLPAPTWLHLAGLFFVICLGILWAVAFTSLMGKASFLLAIVLALGAQLNFIGGDRLIIGQSVLVGLVMVRVFIILYIPQRRTWFSRWISRIEIFNRRLDPGGLDFYRQMMQGDQELVARLVAAGYWEVNQWDGEGKTPLISAVENGMYGLVKRLLKLGGDPNLTGVKGYRHLTPILQAVSKGNAELLRLLLDHGGDPLAEINGTAPIREAVIARDIPCIKMLLDYVEASWQDKSQPPQLIVSYEDQGVSPLLSLVPFQDPSPPLAAVEDHYLYYLKLNITFWVDFYKKLFSGEAYIYDQQAQYLMVLSRHRYTYRREKTTQLLDQPVEVLSQPVGFLRVKDQLEGEAAQSFYLPEGGTYTFPSSCHRVACHHCGGKGRVPCPAECDSGNVLCQAPGCIDGQVPCGSCHGDELLLGDCPDCHEGYQNCELCHGRGYWVCHTCDGSGKVTAEVVAPCSCDRAWQMSCPDCRGTGWKKGYLCVKCHGEKVICGHCQGTKEIKKPGKTKAPCPNCGGSGQIETCQCENGKQICHRCEGKGVLQRECRACSGTGQSTCLKCRGEGQLTCGRCQGWGDLPCDPCGGTGVLYKTEYTNMCYEKLTSKPWDYAVYLPETNQLTDAFEAMTAQQLDQSYRGSVDQGRYMIREALDGHRVDQILVRKSHSKEGEPPKNKGAGQSKSEGERIDDRFISALKQFSVQRSKRQSGRLLEDRGKHGGQGTVEEGSEHPVLMEFIDVLVLKCDVISLSNGERIVLIEERENVQFQHKKEWEEGF